LELFTETLNQFQTKQDFSVNWRKLFKYDVSPHRTCFNHIILHIKRQMGVFQAIWNCLQLRWIGFKRNKLSPSIGAIYLNITFLLIGHVSNTLIYTDRVKCVHFKQLETIYSNAESVSNKTGFLHQLEQTISIWSFYISEMFQIH